jgi:hypothetical protein
MKTLEFTGHRRMGPLTLTVACPAITVPQLTSTQWITKPTARLARLQAHPTARVARQQFRLVRSLWHVTEVRMNAPRLTVQSPRLTVPALMAVLVRRARHPVSTAAIQAWLQFAAPGQAPDAWQWLTQGRRTLPVIGECRPGRWVAMPWHRQQVEELIAFQFHVPPNLNPLETYHHLALGFWLQFNYLPSEAEEPAESVRAALPAVLAERREQQERLAATQQAAERQQAFIAQHKPAFLVQSDQGQWWTEDGVVGPFRFSVYAMSDGPLFGWTQAGHAVVLRVRSRLLFLNYGQTWKDVTRFSDKHINWAVRQLRHAGQPLQVYPLGQQLLDTLTLLSLQLR